MKKLLLSLGVIVSFALYSLHQQNEKTDVSLVLPTIQPTATSGLLPTTVPVTSSSSSSGPKPTNIPTPKISRGKYKDGTFTGSVADAFYGNIQVQTVIQNGKITDIKFLQYPNDRGTSVEINSQAMPYLTQEAIAAQSSQVDIISGATDSSRAFVESLASALSQAQ